MGKGNGIANEAMTDEEESDKSLSKIKHFSLKQSLGFSREIQRRQDGWSDANEESMVKGLIKRYDSYSKSLEGLLQSTLFEYSLSSYRRKLVRQCYSGHHCRGSGRLSKAVVMEPAQ